MSKIEFTDSQRKAIETLDRDVSVSAGAGSGKTEVLVTRFCHVVETGEARVDQILTVTFTEKAAREMKERIIRRFDEKEMEDERRTVESAYIGTIHGFASRVLRENAFEAGVDPRFSVLAEAEASTISRKVFDNLLDTRCKADDPIAISLLDTLGPDELYSVIMSTHARLCSQGITSKQVRLCSPPDANSAVVVLLEATQGVIDFDGKRTPAAEEKIAYIRERFPEIRVLLNRCLDDSNGFDWEAYTSLPRETEIFPLRVSNDLKGLMLEARAALEDVRAILSEAPARLMAESLIDFVRQFQDAYKSEKRRGGYLDFDDMLMVTRDLFVKNGVPSPTALDYQRKFKFVTVDEFQDTNPLQKQIIDAIRRPGRLFTVGDVKQSIYGFINSDVRVFLGHHRSITEEGQIAFQENFRSRAAILEFVNWLFDGMLGEDESMPFERLIPGRKDESNDTPDVEVLLIPADGDAGTNRLAEARAIAQRIRRACGMDGKDALQIRLKDGTMRNADPGDVVILLRATGNVGIYEHALSEVGVPYYVVSGRGYFRTQEVIDVLNLLRIVENPLNDIAMASVLRSPMVRLSNDALFWLTRDFADQNDTVEDDERVPARSRNLGKLYASLRSSKALSQLSKDDASRAREFNEILDALHAMSSDARICEIIEFALEKTSFDRILLAMPNGKRRYANIKKLCDIAQSFDSRSLFGLGDFVRYVSDLETVAEREAEAPTENEAAGVVKIMTVHKSKGLEAPIVFVADASAIAPNDDALLLISREGTAATKAWNPAAGQWEKPKTFNTFREEFKNDDRQERKRLLYVAATRARDLLIFSGSTSMTGKHSDTFSECSSWMKALEKAFSLTEFPEGQEVRTVCDGVKVMISKPSEIDESSCIQPVQPLAQRYHDLIVAGETIPAESNMHFDVKCFSEIPVSTEEPKVHKYGVSHLLDYNDCPRLYELRYLLKASEGSSGNSDSHSDGNSSAELGLAVHEALQAADFNDKFSESIVTLASTYERPLRELVETTCLRMADHKLFPEICSASEILREVPFQFRLGGQFISGRIDMLYRTDEGWTVVDYKTGGDDLKHRYEMQIGIYSLAVKLLFGEVPAKIALIPLGKKGTYVERIPSENGVEAISKTLGTTICEIESGCFPSKISQRCEWCGYASTLCKSGSQEDEIQLTIDL